MTGGHDDEANSLSGRLLRYARVGSGVGGFALRTATARGLGRDAPVIQAADLARMLGGLKGPLMKVAQLAATIPDLLPPEYAAELRTLQSAAPPMGPAFLRRRMRAELGPEWEARFAMFGREPAAAASLGQVHRATLPDGTELACKLQYPDMDSAVAADLGQLGLMLLLQRRFSPEIDMREMASEMSERLREELDYTREAAQMRLYGDVLRAAGDVRVPIPVADLSTRRLLTMTWLDGAPLLDYVARPQEERNRIAAALFHAWWRPFAQVGVIHGDPHLGNYTVFETAGAPAGINLLDFGCVRIFTPDFVAGVIDLYRGFLNADRARIASGFAAWGFTDLTPERVETLSLWARFIFAPLIDNRVRSVADGVAPESYGRREAFEVKQRLRRGSPLTIPRPFVLMNRAAVGLGAVFLHLKAELNFHALFEAEIAGFDRDQLAARQSEAMRRAGL